MGFTPLMTNTGSTAMSFTTTTPATSAISTHRPKSNSDSTSITLKIWTSSETTTPKLSSEESHSGKISSGSDPTDLSTKFLSSLTKNNYRDALE